MAVGPKYRGGLQVFGVPSDMLYFRYEPKEWSHDRETRYAESMLPGAGDPFLQWAGNDALTVSLHLWLNDAANPEDYANRSSLSVKDSIRWIITHTMPTVGVSAFDGSEIYLAPRVLIFFDDNTLSDSHAFKCVITSQRVTRNMMDGNSGEPLRAEMDITLKKYVGYIL